MADPSTKVQDNLGNVELAEALVRAQTAVAEKAVLINHESKSRAMKRREIEEDLKAAKFDDEEPRPYIAYSTEICPHNAPTVGEVDFPKFVIKRGKRNQPDQAVKKVIWLTDYQAERVRRFMPLKFMQLPVRDAEGNPVLDKRTGIQKTQAVPYDKFCRLVKTQVTDSAGSVIEDPSELLNMQAEKVKRLEEELAEFRAGKMPQAPEKDSTLEAANKQLKAGKSEAIAREAEALARDPETIPDKNAFRRGRQ